MKTFAVASRRSGPGLVLVDVYVTEWSWVGMHA